MIIGTGIDLVEIARIEEVLSKRSDRFISHVLHDAELPAFEEARFKANMLAKRFAVKEAATKALGTCLLYTSPSPRDKRQSRMPSSA